jgi:hypothetical protein
MKNKVDLEKLMNQYNLNYKQLIQYGSLALGGLILFIGFISIFSGQIKAGFSFTFIGLIIAVIPISIIQYLKSIEIEELENEFPKFLRDFAEDKKSGMTFQQALETRADTKYGQIDKYLIKAKNQLSWGIPFEKVLSNLGENLKQSKLISRSFMIIIEAFNAGGNVTEIMDDLSSDIRILKEVDQDRKNALEEQVWMIYIITIFFIIILLMLYKLLIPMIAGGGLGAAFGSSGAEPPVYCTGISGFVCNICLVFNWGITSCDRSSEIDKIERDIKENKILQNEGKIEIDRLKNEEKQCLNLNTNIDLKDLSNNCYFKALFMYMALIQGLFGGIIAGEIASSSIPIGLKHSMILISIVLFSFIIF